MDIPATVDELQAWSAISTALVRELHHAVLLSNELRERAIVETDEAQAFLAMVRRATHETSRHLSSSRYELMDAQERVAEAHRSTNAQLHADDARRQRELHDTAAGLRREVDALSALRDRLRAEVCTVSAVADQQQPAAASPVAAPHTPMNHASLTALRTVREQLRDIREANSVRTASPIRNSPGATMWKERLLKLQGDLRTLRTELNTPTREATYSY